MSKTQNNLILHLRHSLLLPDFLCLVF
uniref:Uncharacterized protein n=1 Tax=Rhizophora mucronata TaxID=61149 RepID=A0A2P2PBR8_RHIMU